MTALMIDGGTHDMRVTIDGIDATDLLLLREDTRRALAVIAPVLALALPVLQALANETGRMLPPRLSVRCFCDGSRHDRDETDTEYRDRILPDLASIMEAP